MEEGQDLSKIKGIIRRRKWWFILPFVGLTLVSVIVSFILPNTYISTAAILIESQQIPSTIVPSTVTSFAEQRIQSITQEVMSRSRILKLIEKYDLLPNKREKLKTEDLVDEIRKRMTLIPINAEINKETQSRPVYLTIAFTLSYEDEEPRKAQAVANEIASLYMEKNLQSREKHARGTTKFLQEQLNDVKAEMDALETKLAEYRKAHLEELPEFTVFNMQKAEKLSTEISSLSAQIQSLEEQSSAVKGRLALEKPRFSVSSGGGGTPDRVLSADERLQQLELEKAALQSKYSPQHPVVQAKNREISLLEGKSVEDSPSGQKGEQLQSLQLKLADLKSRYSDEHPSVKRTVQEIEKLKEAPAVRADKKKSSTGGPRIRNTPNPAFVTLKSEQERLSIAVASSRTEKDRLIKEREDVYRKLHAAPQITKEYNEMNTDYQIAKTQYNEIRQKLLAAEVAQGMEEQQLGETFQVVEPAFLPEKPDKPHRLVIILVGMLLAFGISVGAASLKEYSDRSVQDSETVERITGLPVLSMLPNILVPEEMVRRKRRKLIFLASAAAGIVVLLVAFHLLIMDLHVFYAKVERFLKSRMFI